MRDKLEYRTGRGTDSKQVLPTTEIFSGKNKCIYNRRTDAYGTLAQLFYALAA